MLRGVEYVHHDHNYWFSYNTITTLIKKHGYEVRDVVVYTFQPIGTAPVQAMARRAPRLFTRYLRAVPRLLMARLLYRLNPFWGDGLIVVSRLKA
jgi:hypothetical protein